MVEMDKEGLVEVLLLYRSGLVRNNDLRVPVLNTGSILERVPLSKSQNFAGSAEPVEPVLTRPLLTTPQCQTFKLFKESFSLIDAKCHIVSITNWTLM